MAIDDPATFEFDSSEYTFILLAVCGRMPEEQACVIAGM